jgi:hypothetical protein
MIWPEEGKTETHSLEEEDPLAQHLVSWPLSLRLLSLPVMKPSSPRRYFEDDVPPLPRAVP